MSKFCKKCGNELKDDAMFCDKCGNSTEGEVNNQTPPKKKHGCLIVIIVFVLLIGGIMVLGRSPEEQNTDENVASETEQSTENTDVAIGTEGNIGELTLIVNSVSEAESISVADGMFGYKPDSGKYAIVNVTIKNSTKESKSLLLNYFKLIGPDEAKYVATIITMADEKYITIDTINPNLDITGNLVFEIPKDLAASDCLLQYSDYDWTSEVAKFKLQ